MIVALTFTAEDGRRLLQFARESIQTAVEGRRLPEVGPEQLSKALLQPLGAFVTLYRGDELRGCIGRLQYDTPLYRNVIESAVSSALNDPRFSCVSREEMTELRIEIAVLDQPRTIERLEEFDETQHGIVMKLGLAHGVFLPKVAREHQWDMQKTLSMLCRKIGLHEQAWLQAQARFQVFNTQEFAEE